MSVSDDASAVTAVEVNGTIPGYFYEVGSYGLTQGADYTFNGTAYSFHAIDSQPTGSYGDVGNPPGLFIGHGPLQSYEAVGTSSDGQVLFFTLAGFAVEGDPTSANQQLYAVSSNQLPLNVPVSFNSNNVPYCFAEGTLIETARGIVAVQNLEVGDQIRTASGAFRPLIWIGSQRMRCGLHVTPETVSPVVFEVDALAPGVPDQPLRLSPGHGVAVVCGDEVLIPAEALVNGATIRRDLVAEVVYWHVELDQHDLIVAHGMPVESYLDIGNRHAFSGNEMISLRLIEPTGEDDGSCRPRIADGVVVRAVRERLTKRAASLGWSLNTTSPNIQLLDNGEPIIGVFGEEVARFMLVEPSSTLRLTSESGRPNLWDSACEDTRVLGIKIRSICIENSHIGRREFDLEASAFRHGFHNVEENGNRWTNGNALLPVDLFDGCVGTTYLEIWYSDACRVAWDEPVIRDERAGTFVGNC